MAAPAHYFRGLSGLVSGLLSPEEEEHPAIIKIRGIRDKLLHYPKLKNRSKTTMIKE
jgi:hypothetical protein